ncbi:MAG: hypothetical protein R2867_47230 [Caldilineaceae bacterium]
MPAVAGRDGLAVAGYCGADVYLLRLAAHPLAQQRWQLSLVKSNRAPV